MKKNNTKLKTIILLAVWVLLLFLIPFSVNKIEDNLLEGNESYISSELYIEDYNVTLDVNRNGKIDVTEAITVNIDEDNLKGIYRSVSLWQKYYDNDLNELSKKVAITNFRTIGEKFELNSSNSSVGIKIGSEKTSVGQGLHTYTIKYRYDMGKDNNKSFDNLVFSIRNDGNINNTRITVNMPDAFDINEVSVMVNDYDISDSIIVQEDDNVLTIDVSGDKLDELLILNMNLKDGYFKGASSNYGYICISICIAIILVSLGSFVAWVKYGKDYNKRAVTVEFFPPEDLDAAQIGFIYGEKSIKKLVIALIIQLASKGYILIEETEDKKFNIVNISKNNKLLKPLSINEQIIFQELFKKADTNLLYLDTSFTQVFPKINTSLQKTINKKINDLDSGKMTNVIFGILFISIIVWTYSYLFINDIDPSYKFLNYLAFASIFIMGFFTLFMGRKTAYGEVISAKVAGFRDFLVNAEKDRLESLVEDDPNYFYDILPYTYVFNISDKWIDRFGKENVVNINIDDLQNYENSMFMIITE